MAKRKNKESGVYRGPITRSKSSILNSRPINLSNEEEFPILTRLGLYAADIEGDGNCLFRALSDQYYGDGGKGGRHQEIRRNVCQYMKDNREHFEPFLDETESFDERMKRMEEDSVYGDNTEIVAFAQRYQTNVHIYQADQTYVVSCNMKNSGDCHIAYHTWEHYSSVRNKEGPHEGPPCVKRIDSSIVQTKSAQTSSQSNSVPQWKYDVVIKSLPYVVSESQMHHVMQVILDNHGDISKSVEALLEAPEEDTAPQDNLKSNGDTPPKQHAAITKEKRAKKLSAREKKERQKRQALERKKERGNELESTPQVTVSSVAI